MIPDFERFRFGFGTAGEAGPGLAVPVLGGSGGETLFAQARGAGRAAGFELFAEGDWLLGVRIEEAAADMGEQTRMLYNDLLGLMRERGLAAVRIWNFVPSINEASAEGLENYRVFCRGRAQAYEHELVGIPPAASAVGGVSGRLAVYFAACAVEPRRVENPEQVPAYAYPLEYGPRAPSFSRAAQVTVNGKRLTFVSGTAAIKGHATVAGENLAQQIDCTLDNLGLISVACGLGSDLGAGTAVARHFKVYVRHAADFETVRAALDARLFRVGDQVCWLRSDICRAELLFEVEATVVE